MVSVLRGATQVSEPIPSGEFLTISASAHAELKAEPIEVALTEQILKDAMELVQTIDSNPPLEVYQRAISWYARGIADSDLVDKFIDHWITLETLSNVFTGSVDPRKCHHCKEVIDPRPDGAVLTRFLETLGFDKGTVGTVREFSGIRGGLFHEAKASDQARAAQPTLTNILRNCLSKCLQNAGFRS